MEAVAIFCKPRFQYKPLVAETVSTLAHVLYTLAIYRVSLQAYYALLSFKTEARAVKNDREVALIRRMLGCIHYKLAEYKEATENVLKALEWYHQDQGSSINIPLCFHTLGLIHGESGNLPRALEMFQNTLQWCEAHGDEEIKMVCLFSIEMAKLLCAASDFDKADEEFTASVQQHLSLCDEKVEHNQNGVGIDFNIGRARRMSRDCDTRGAVLEMRRGFRRILGDYPYTSLNLIVFVELLFLRPEHSDFHSLLDSACKVFQEVCDNEDTAIMFLFKALHAGKDEAMSDYNHALEILRQILGDHLLTVITLRNKAQFLQGIRIMDESCAAYRESLSMVSRIVCDHPLHATVLHELGLVMADLGLKDDGLWHCERALEMRQRILGEDHKSTIESKKAVRSLADTFEELDLCGDSEDEW
ncbi:uncharacterized protein LOC106175489 [Lingula anatina]|uniref:Uncharacterized protein LOC106175489 n=1 Tax=Lingula anatina TaxID=7574 RepID=A0A1S3JRK5_LINAN|nr:uncharacterized protein LOC106175489 [Lingula anatina]|eukprot:XP_013412972.1 uncharacterized protein LOC106175489 [Lingula anatina]